MVESFFSVAQMHNLQTQSHPDSIILLSGPPSSGKTSLLFQFAFNSAMDSGGTVVFICSRRKFETKPPFLSQGIDPSSDTYQRIQMKYVDDAEGIKSYFAAFHMHDAFPASVVIDDFASFFSERNCQERYNNSRGKDLALVGTLALCYNAINHASKTRPCKLLFSDTHHGDSPRMLYIYKRWVSAIYTIKGDGSGSFVLKNDCHSEKPEYGRFQAAKYSVALQYLVLETIWEKAEHQE